MAVAKTSGYIRLLLEAEERRRRICRILLVIVDLGTIERTFRREVQGTGCGEKRQETLITFVGRGRNRPVGAGVGLVLCVHVGWPLLESWESK